jgi:hypothetical protein
MSIPLANAELQRKAERLRFLAKQKPKLVLAEKIKRRKERENKDKQAITEEL